MAARPRRSLGSFGVHLFTLSKSIRALDELVNAPPPPLHKILMRSLWLTVIRPVKSYRGGGLVVSSLGYGLSYPGFDSNKIRSLLGELSNALESTHSQQLWKKS